MGLGRASAALALALAAALGLAAGCRSAESRLERANALRLEGEPKAALEGYKAILAELGDAPLPSAEAQTRLKALRFAGDVSYLELGDYPSAMAYYRRIVSLAPGAKEAREARVVIGDILQDRYNDRLGAIAQWAEVARTAAPEAPRYQLAMARAYLELKKYEQARVEAKALCDRWPTDALADEAQLLIGQALSLEKREGEAISVLDAVANRRARPDVAARALEAEAHLFAQQGDFDRALALYEGALEGHPNPDAVKTAIEAVRERRERAGPAARPGDRAAAFDHK
jgi:tetratricopeptide (TPR) repeat protein